MISMPGFGRRRRAIFLTVLILIAILYLLHIGIYDGTTQPWKFDQHFKYKPSFSTTEKLKNPFYFRNAKSSHCNKKLNDFLRSTYFGMRTTADRIWNYVPMQLSTTLEWFPNHVVYSNMGATIGSTKIIDILGTLDTNTLQQHPDLESYRTRRYGLDQDWGWDPSEYEEMNAMQLLSLMNYPIITHMQQHAPKGIQWYILTDESSYVSAEALYHILSKEDPSVPLILTWESRPGAPIQMIWSVSAFNAVLGDEFSKFERQIPSGNLSSTVLTQSNWCEPLALFRDLDPWEVQALYDRDASNSPSITHSDYYRDYLLPFLKTERPNWEINPSGSVFTEDYNETIQPQKVKRHCKWLCEQNENCVAWQWREGTECALETDLGMRRGHSKNPHLDTWTDQTPLVTTGYMLDRIRSFRNSSTCDPLVVAGIRANETSDDENTAEGWFFLLKERIKEEGSDVLQALNKYKQLNN